MIRDLAVIGVHGYKVSDYRNSTGLVIAECERRGIQATNLVYHADTVIAARKKNQDIARRLAGRVALCRQAGYTNIVVVAHSNGVAALRMAYDLYKPPITVAICVQPALPSNLHPFPAARTLVLWNDKDRVVRMGKILTWLTKWFISEKAAAQRNWGEMGATGYIGDAPNLTNIDTQDINLQAYGHSSVFETWVREHTVPYIVDRIEDAVAG